RDPPALRAWPGDRAGDRAGCGAGAGADRAFPRRPPGRVRPRGCAGGKRARPRRCRPRLPHGARGRSGARERDGAVLRPDQPRLRVAHAMAFLYKSEPERGAVWARLFAERLPDLPFRIWPEIGRPEEIRFMAAWLPPADFSPFRG